MNELIVGGMVNEERNENRSADGNRFRRVRRRSGHGWDPVRGGRHRHDSERCTEASKPGQSDATEEPCEAKALAKFAKTKTVGCPACINLSSLATTVEGLVDSNNNQVWCDSTGTPFGGDDTGFKPDVTTTAGK